MEKGTEAKVPDSGYLLCKESAKRLLCLHSVQVMRIATRRGMKGGDSREPYRIKIGFALEIKACLTVVCEAELDGMPA